MKHLLVLLILAFSTLPGKAAAQQLGGGASPDVSLLRVVLALIVCVMIAGLAILFVRYRLGLRGLPLGVRLPRRDTRIRPLESRRISAQSEVCLFEFGGEEYLILVASSGTLLLSSKVVPPPAPEEA